MKRLVLLLLLVSSTAYADCHMRVQTKLSRKSVFGQPTDHQQLVVPDAKGFMCVTRYRMNVDLDWQTFEGTGVGATRAEACANAANVNRGVMLAEVDPMRVTSDQQMVCSDIPEIRVHPVRIGDVIWESETDVHVMPAERPYFNYKGTQCRMFVERGSNDKNFFTHQGIICRLNTTKNSKWQVVDKY